MTEICNMDLNYVKGIAVEQKQNTYFISDVNKNLMEKNNSLRTRVKSITFKCICVKIKVITLNWQYYYIFYYIIYL